MTRPFVYYSCASIRVPEEQCFLVTPRLVPKTRLKNSLETTKPVLALWGKLRWAVLKEGLVWD